PSGAVAAPAALAATTDDAVAPDAADDPAADPASDDAGVPTEPTSPPAEPSPAPSGQSQTDDATTSSDEDARTPSAAETDAPALVAPAAPGAPTAEETGVPVLSAPVKTGVQALSAPGGISLLAAGVPEAGTPVWTETFEQGLSATTPSGITAYAGSRFTANAAWATGTNCTGVLVNYTASYPNSAFCPSEPILIGIGGSSTLGAREVRRLADVLGQVGAGVTGSTSSTGPVAATTAATQANHALTAAPYATLASGNSLVLRSASAIGVTAPTSRYYAIRADVAGDECASTPASLTFSLLSGGTTYAPFTVVPCTNAAGTYYTSTPALAATGGGLDGSTALAASVRAGTYTGGAALLTSAQIAAAQVNVTNTLTTATGNAFAIDNLRVLDVTPRLDLAFAPASVVAGTAATLTYTVTNTNDLLAKSDWSFTNALPAGLVVASTPAVGGTCANATGTAFSVTAAAGASTISAAGGDLAANAVSCTITVNVVSQTAGTYVNAPSNLTTPLVAASSATVTVTPAASITVLKNITARANAADQFTLSLRSGTTTLASATTSGSTLGVQTARVDRYVVTPGTRYTIAEQLVGGTGINYGTSYECVRSGTVIASGTSTAAPITIPDEPGVQVVCTFTNTPRTPQLYCDNSHFYSVDATGILTQVDIATGTTTTVATWPGVTSVNGLGIGANGSVAYAFNRTTDSTDIASILKYTPGGTPVALPDSAYVTRAGNTSGSTIIDGGIVAGALDLTSNRFLFGKFNGGFFYLWSFTESTPNSSGFRYLGRFSTGTATVGNGDMAFDSVGNLFVLGAASSGTSSTATIFTVTASTLAAAAGGTLAVNATVPATLTGMNSGQALTSITGLAFSPRGTIYLSSSTDTSASTGMYEFDATTFVRVAGTPRIPTAAVDLASCASPASVTLQKNVVGRIAASDQFQLSVSRDGTVAASATTSGAATGLQPAQVGPLPVAAGSTLTIAEAIAAGSTSTLGAYTIIYECWSEGVRITTGTTASATVSIPDRLSTSVNCTFFNSPRPATTVTVTKQIRDATTGAITPGAGWTLGVTATATTGTVTVLPGESATQVTDAAGTATWLALFGSASSRATLVVYEEQRTGFAFVSASCTVGGAAVPVTVTSSAGVVRGTITGIQSASAVACTIVNEPVALLTLVKQVGFGAALPSDWTLSAAAAAPARPGPSGRSGTGGVSAVPVTPGVPYRLAESGGTALYVQVGAWSCVTATGTAVPVTAAGDVTLPASTTVTCTVTNSAASITLLKQVQDPRPGFEADDWTLTATPAAFGGGALPTVSRPGAEYTPGSNTASTFEVRPGHSYTLSERVAETGSRLAYRTVRLERLDGSTWTPVPLTAATASATITAPAPGQNAVYRFVNAPVSPTTLPLTGGPSSDAFLIAGSLVLVLALASALWHGRRRRRRLS
ncbi:MAG TPA: hypothetical protein VJU58_02675, partial [Microbacterium sp.]|nr:hypothetical protein [Microbacterium sp.]